MAIPWLVVLKAVPWTQVISNAPKVADGAKKLWNSVSRTSPAPVPPAARPIHPDLPGSASIATMQERLAEMEIAADKLHEQMLASSELIKTLAEQNTQLIQRVEETRVRVVRLTVASAVIAVIAGISLIVTFSS